MHSANVLLVDDNLEYRDAVAGQLRAAFPQLHVMQCGDSVCALEKLHNVDVDVVLLDIELPGENGLQLARRIENLGILTVVVILSYYDLPEYRAEALLCGVKYFVSKSAPAKEILDVIKMLVRS